jgi:hypothetical protein
MDDQLPEDILFRLKKDFTNEADFDEALRIIHCVKNDNLNVGWVQLSRGMILLAEGNLHELKDMFESRYYGDPRDLLMGVVAKFGTTNFYGMTPFDMENR